MSNIELDDLLRNRLICDEHVSRSDHQFCTSSPVVTELRPRLGICNEITRIVRYRLVSYYPVLFRMIRRQRGANFVGDDKRR